MRTLTTGATQDSDLLRPVEKIGCQPQLKHGRTNDRRRMMDSERQRRLGTLALQHVSRDHHHRDPSLGDGGAHCNPQHSRHLVGLRDQFAVVAAIPENMRGIGFLEVAAAYLLAWNLGGDGQHRHAAAVAIVKAVDQVQVARATASRAYGNLAGKLALGTGGKGGGLLMAHMHPFNLLVSANGVGDPIERVAGDAINTFHPSLGQGCDEHLRDFHSQTTSETFMATWILLLERSSPQSQDVYGP